MFEELKSVFLREFPYWELDCEGFEVITFTSGDRVIKFSRQSVGIRFRVETDEGTVLGQGVVPKPLSPSSLWCINKYLY